MAHLPGWAASSHRAGYLLAGDSPLLVQVACERICAQGRSVFFQWRTCRAGLPLPTEQGVHLLRDACNLPVQVAGKLPLHALCHA